MNLALGQLFFPRMGDFYDAFGESRNTGKSTNPGNAVTRFVSIARSRTNL
jgi:hypothetical protein